MTSFDIGTVMPPEKTNRSNFKIGKSICPFVDCIHSSRYEFLSCDIYAFNFLYHARTDVVIFLSY